MPFVGSVIPVSTPAVGRPDQTARRARDERDERGGVFVRTDDDADLTVAKVETTEAVRSVKSNDAEESHEDRMEHGYYRPTGQPRASAGSTLDVEG